MGFSFAFAQEIYNADFVKRVFHGDQDDIIPVLASIQMIDALEKAHAKEVNFTRYPDLKHDSWTPTYNNPDIYRWMLSHARETSSTEGGQNLAGRGDNVT